MINKLKKFFKKNKKIITAVLIILVGLYLYNQSYHKLVENFVISNVNTKKINNGLDSILACEKSGKCVGKTDLITDFMSFKKRLGYPNFSVALFNDLLTKRKAKDEPLSREEIVFLVKKGKYSNSFKKELKEGFDFSHLKCPNGLTQTNLQCKTPDGKDVCILVGPGTGELPNCSEYTPPPPPPPEIPPELEQIDPDSDAGQCVQSLKQVKNLVKTEQEKMEKAYNDDLTKWKAAKKSAVDSFRKDHLLWKKYCQTSSDCTPVGAYFKTFRGGKDGTRYVRETLQRTTFNECLAACRKRPWCDWVDHEGTTCWISKGLDNTSYDLGFKTDTGMRVVEGRDYSGSKISDSKVSNRSECFSKCKYEPKCDVAVYKHSNKQCWLKHIKDKNQRVGIKNKIAGSSAKFGDSHVYIKDILDDPKPKRSDYPLVVNVPNIICQDCRQAARNIDTADSTDINFDQLQQCIVNKAEAEAAGGNGGTSGGTSGGNGGTSGGNGDSDRVTEGDQNTEVSGGNTGLIVGLSVGGLVIMIFSVILAIVFTRRR